MLPPVSVLPPNATDPPRPSSLPVRSTRRPETLPLMTNVLRRVELVTVTCSRDAAPLIPKLRRQSYRRVSRDCQRARESATDGCPCSSRRPSIPVGATACGGRVAAARGVAICRHSARKRDDLALLVQR